MPVHQDLLKYWVTNKEVDPVKKALRFVFLSNFTFLGNGNTVRFGDMHAHKNSVYKHLDKTIEMLDHIQFLNLNFRDFLSSVSFKNKDTAFVYNDPPYLGTGSNYENKGWLKSDFEDLLKVSIESGVKFAISEFDNDFVISEAKSRRLNVIEIGERRNIGNRRVEILITNYDNQAPTLF